MSEPMVFNDAATDDEIANVIDQLPLDETALRILASEFVANVKDAITIDKQCAKLAAENESLQSELSAARQQIDEARRQMVAARIDEDGDAQVTLYGSGLPEGTELYAAPVPAQPAAVPEAVAKDAARCGKCGGADYAAHELYCADHPDAAILSAADDEVGK